MRYLIQKVIPAEAGKDAALEDVETFEEEPAPAVTLGGRLLALKNATGFEHISTAL
jgi:hypothetical protein